MIGIVDMVFRMKHRKSNEIENVIYQNKNDEKKKKQNKIRKEKKVLKQNA